MYERVQEPASNCRVDVFLRSITPTLGGHATRRNRFEGLEAAVEQGTIDTYDVTVLGDEICLCDSCAANYMDESWSDLVDTIRDWEYEELDASGFVVRTVSSSITNERYRAVVPPEISFGIYLDDSLVGVFPCEDGEQSYGPETYLEGLGSLRENRQF